MTENKPKTHPSTQQSAADKPSVARFISLRWRFVPPLFVVVLIIAVAGAYWVARNLTGGLEQTQENALLQSSRTVAERAGELYERHRNEAQRVAFTVGVAEAVRDADAEGLQSPLRSLARAAELDVIVVTGLDGIEVLGVQRTGDAEDTSYALSRDTDLSGEMILRAVLDEGYVGATGLMRTPGGLTLFTAAPITLDDVPVGVVLVGQGLDRVLADMKGSALADLSLYGPEGILLQTTFAAGDNRSTVLEIPREVFGQALVAVQQIPVQTLDIDGQMYQAAYQPFNYGPNTLGVVGAVMRDDVPFMTEVGRQLVAVMAAALAGGAVLAAYIGISRVAGRAEQVARVADALARGERAARTQMAPTDEIRAVGKALDQYADFAQRQEDTLRGQLKRQRREISHLMSVLEGMPEGVVVQDVEGRVLLMNDPARTLLGSHRVFRSAGLGELASVVTSTLGAALAPGLYALGDPKRVELDDRMLSAQAAAVASATKRRLGTVVLLRDITDFVRQEQQRDRLLIELTKEIQEPLAGLGRMGARSESGMVNAFAREVSRHAIALNKMVMDMRELSSVDALTVKRSQKPMMLETLVWKVANEWRQVAQADGLTMHVLIEQHGLYILGDEKRLRWAIGNVLDNAIKYTPSGGALTLEIKPEDGDMANLRVRDNGVGILREERPHVFTRFFRGNPTAEDGAVIRVPGMGQGLFIARQIIEAHGGKIHFKSRPAFGTAVYFSLPLTAPVTMDMPRMMAEEMEGDTIRLPVELMVDFEED